MVKLHEAMTYGNGEVFHPYEGFEADVGFWYGEYCKDVDAGLSSGGGTAEYIAEKIDEEHPTESPEQFKSLVRLVRETYPKAEKKWSANIREASEQPFVFIKIFDPYEDGEARATVQSYGGPMAYNVWSISKENIQDIKDELPDWENRIAFYRYYSNGKLGGKLSEAQISGLGHALAGKNVGKRIREAQANLAYYGFRRVPEEDFSDDGTRFFMYVWDPENTGKSPFYFSKAGGYGMVFFSEHIYYMYNNADELRKAIRAHGYHLDDLNGINKENFTDEALGKIVAQLQEIRESNWFEDICPEFSTRGAIDRGVEVKDYNADKDHQRVMDIAKRANSDPEKMAKLAANMAKAIGDKEKMRSRWQAAVDVYGSESPVAKAFEAQVKDRGWSINIRPRSGDIDWSSLFESINDKSIYDAHAEYKKDQLKKKEDDNIETGVFVVTDFSDDSYKNPKVKRIKIADGVTSIKEDAFFNCKNLTEVIIPDSVTTIGDFAFANCEELKTIKIPKNVTSIGKGAFCGCIYMTSIIIPDSVTTIEDSTFSNCMRLETIKIPKNVTSIEEGAFFHCARLTSIIIPDSVTSIGNLAFANCIRLKTIKIPNSVTSIGDRAFYNCYNLESIKMPESATSIGFETFRSCNSLKSINIPKGVTAIENSTFFLCKNLTEVIIPDSVTSIENDAFENCKNLKTIHYAGTRDQWNAIEKAFDWIPSTRELMIDYNYQESSTFDEGSVKLATVVKESAERKYWNNFFDKITESVDSDRIETLLKNYFDTDDVSLSDETCWGLPVYIVDNKRYAVGDSDDVYDAAVQQAIDVFEDDTDEGKIRWLQKNNWPGVDEESVCNDLGDNPDDYEEESIYKPSSIDEYIDTMGYTDAAEAFSMAFIGNYLDKRELGEYIVDSDGVEPLASEDGREISIGDDLSAFCLGGAY